MNTFLNGNVRFQALPHEFLVYSDGAYTPFFEEFPAGSELMNAEK